MWCELMRRFVGKIKKKTSGAFVERSVVRRGMRCGRLIYISN